MSSPSMKLELPRLFSCAQDMPSSLPPQGLCTCCTFSLGSSLPRYPHGCFFFFFNHSDLNSNVTSSTLQKSTQPNHYFFVFITLINTQNSFFINVNIYCCFYLEYKLLEDRICSPCSLKKSWGPEQCLTIRDPQ